MKFIKEVWTQALSHMTNVTEKTSIVCGPFIKSLVGNKSTKIVRYSEMLARIESSSVT